MKMSDRFVKGPWRYEQIDGASHWIPLEASDQLNQLLIEWLGSDEFLRVRGEWKLLFADDLSPDISK